MNVVIVNYFTGQIFVLQNQTKKMAYRLHKSTNINMKPEFLYFLNLKTHTGFRVYPHLETSNTQRL